MLESVGGGILLSSPYAWGWPEKNGGKIDISIDDVTLYTIDVVT